MDVQETSDQKYPTAGNGIQDGAPFLNGGHKYTNGQKNGDIHVQELCDHLKTVDDNRSYSCGLWSFKPKWLQSCANKKAFLAIFCLTTVLQGMYYTYFVSVLTTIEKLYQIQSKTTGIIMSATEIGQIGGALLLTYYGGQGHRPKWIACGMIMFAVASIICSMPHFLFNDVTPSAYYLKNSSSTATLDLRSKLCHANYLHSNNISDAYNSSLITFINSSSPLVEMRTVDDDRRVTTPSSFTGIISPGDSTNKCSTSGKGGNLAHTVLAIFFISLLLIGIGATTVYTLGIPYIDDNVATRESPLYFGITIGVRIFGPVFGFLLGSFCTSIYVNFPFEDPGISNDDPQWIGAWWLGVFIVGAALILTSFPMMAFPRKLPQPNHVHPIHANGSANGNCIKSLNSYVSRKPVETPSLRDFPAAMRRLLRNDILLCRTASSVLHILPIAGLYTFLPKYLESQFQLTATKANMISGMAGILVMGIGIFASGSFMRKFKPNAQFVAKWIAAAALAYAFGMFVLMWLGCPLNTYVGLNSGSSSMNNAQLSCNDTCDCKFGQFSPVCSSDGITYLSPCLAGCTQVTSSKPGDQYYYEECYCLGQNITVSNGFCPLKCENLVWYIVIFSVFVLIHSTSEVGSMLLTLRCVDPQDKAMALGLISFAIGLFGNVPCPIIYGAVVDSACLFWEDHCGEQGACRVYDPATFRMVFHGVTAVIMLIAFFVDVAVCVKAKAIHFHETSEENDDAEESVPINGTQCTQFETSV